MDVTKYLLRWNLDEPPRPLKAKFTILALFYFQHVKEVAHQ